jgi:hypothetical protein
MTEPLKTITFTFRTDAALAARLREYAKANPGSIGEHVRAAVVQYLNGADGLTARIERLEEFVGWAKDYYD